MIFFENYTLYFSILLETNQGNIFQGTLIENLKIIMKISNLENFIATSIISDENYCYTGIPYPSYEFRIPIDMLNCSDNYGFYLFVFDVSSNEYYSWPENSTRIISFDFPNLSIWDDIISPDKSLPELNLPMSIFTILIFIIII